jgi:hypothetical protein
MGLIQKRTQGRGKERRWEVKGGGGEEGERTVASNLAMRMESLSAYRSPRVVQMGASFLLLEGTKEWHDGKGRGKLDWISMEGERGRRAKEEGNEPVSTPGSKELDKDVLVVSVLVDDLVILVRDELPNALGLGGDRGGLDVGLDFSLLKRPHELLDRLCVPRDGPGLERVLGLGSEVLNGERGPDVSRQVEALGVVDELDGVDGDKRDLALVLGGDRPERLEEGLVGPLLGVVDESVGDGDTGLGVEGEVLRADLVEERHGVDLDPGAKGFGSQGSVSRRRESVGSLVKGLVKDDGRGRGRDGGERERRGVVGVAEEVRVAVGIGVGGEGLGGVGSGRSVGDKDNLVRALELVVVRGGDLRDSGEGLPGRKGEEARGGGRRESSRNQQAVREKADFAVRHGGAPGELPTRSLESATKRKRRILCFESDSLELGREPKDHEKLRLFRIVESFSK